MSTIKVDGELKDELTRLQTLAGNDKSLSYNDIVWKAVKSQALTPILMRYIYSRIGDWNPYDLLSWFYEEMRTPLDKELVEAYAQLIVETKAS
ncbi:hypothetical protein E4H04_00660 [Candidatus Bathyarchaeota archaeon]|nr:MAG: hypothetical protein E4H04_00660 [Candidatus Bathyarchaeota archaeon]